MDRLSIFLTLMTGAVLTGIFIVPLFSLGYFNWYAVLGSAAGGFILSWPVSYVISRRIKRHDPAWDHRKAKQVNKTIPDPNAPEV